MFNFQAWFNPFTITFFGWLDSMVTGLFGGLASVFSG